MEPTTTPLSGLAAPGHAWYYATRHLPPAQRLQQRALQAWWRALRDLPQQVSDPGVAAAKLAWWQRQLQLLAAGDRPDHPLLLVLQPALKTPGAPLQALLEAVAQVEAGMRQTRWLDRPGLERHLDAGPGNVARASSWLLGASDAPAQAWSAALGVALARVAALRDLGRELRRDVLPLPMDALAAHAVPARQLLDARDAPAVRALLGAEIAQLRANLEELRRNRPAGLGAAARPAAVLIRIALTLLDELGGADVDLLRQRVTLPPTRMLWASLLAGWKP